MGDVNHCIFTGRFAANPEVRFAPSGDAITNVTIAVGSSWKNKEGEWQERTEWVRCVAFRKLAEIIGEKYGKGDKVLIVGEQRARTWTDKDGNEKVYTEINVDEINMLESRKAKREAAEGVSSAPPAAIEPAVLPDDEDGIPF